MTLNTFHFSGRGDMNITLGIPRLREILMMASKTIKTPSMDIPFKKNIPNLPKVANSIRVKLTRCTLFNVIKDVKIDRRLELDPERRLVYTLRMEFLPHKSYKNEFCVNPKSILTKVEKYYFDQIFKRIKRKNTSESKKSPFIEENKNQSLHNIENLEDDGDIDDNEVKKVKRFDFGEMHVSSDEEDVPEDADATVSKSVSRHKENQEYDDPDEDELINYAENDDDEEEENNDNKLNQTTENTQEDINNSILIDKSIAGNRKNMVLGLSPKILDYKYDADKSLWCEIVFWVSTSFRKLWL